MTSPHDLDTSPARVGGLQANIRCPAGLLTVGHEQTRS